MSNSSIWPIDRTLSGAITPGQSGPGSDGNKGVLRISQSTGVTGASPSDCLVTYPGHSLEESYPSAEMQSVYFTAPTDWATVNLNFGDRLEKFGTSILNLLTQKHFFLRKIVYFRWLT